MTDREAAIREALHELSQPDLMPCGLSGFRHMRTVLDNAPGVLAELAAARERQGEAEALLGEVDAGGTPAGLVPAIHNLISMYEKSREREAKLREALRPFTNYDLHAVHWRDKHYRLVPHTVIAEWIAHIENARDVLAEGEGET